MPRTPRRTRLVALAAAAAVGITAAAARALTGQAAAQAPSPAAAPHLGGRTTEAKYLGEPPSQLPLAFTEFPPEMVRVAKLSHLDVAVTGRQVAVSGNVEAVDKVPGSSYIWLLRVYTNDKQRQLLKEHHYLDQAVTLPEGEVAMNPAFNDTIELPPGGYKVELTMYAVPPDFPFKKVKFGEDMRKKAIIKVSGLRKVEIAD